MAYSNDGTGDSTSQPTYPNSSPGDSVQYDPSLGDQWWNKGKPQSQWTQYPPNDTGANPSQTPTPAPASSPWDSSWFTSTQGQTIPGFDQGKWNDPNKRDPKYDAGHMIAAGVPLEQVGAFIQANYPGYKYLGGDKIQGPDGFIYDFKNSSGAAQWTQVGGGDGSGGGTAGTGGSSIGGSFGSASDFLASLGLAPGSSGGFMGGQAGDLYNLLMQRATQTLTPSAQDPIIANQVNAYSAQQQRAARNYIDDLAESRGPISNLQGEKRLAAEKIGQSVGSYQAQLMQHEIDARRQEIQNALNGAAGFLTEEQRMALQRELAYLDMSQRAYEFDVNDEFRRSPLAS